MAITCNYTLITVITGHYLVILNFRTIMAETAMTDFSWVDQLPNTHPQAIVEFPQLVIVSGDGSSKYFMT